MSFHPFSDAVWASELISQGLVCFSYRLHFFSFPQKVLILRWTAFKPLAEFFFSLLCVNYCTRSPIIFKSFPVQMKELPSSRWKKTDLRLVLFPWQDIPGLFGVSWHATPSVFTKLSSWPILLFLFLFARVWCRRGTLTSCFFTLSTPGSVWPVIHEDKTTHTWSDGKREDHTLQQCVRSSPLLNTR